VIIGNRSVLHIKKLFQRSVVFIKIKATINILMIQIILFLQETIKTDKALETLQK